MCLRCCGRNCKAKAWLYYETCCYQYGSNNMTSSLKLSVIIPTYNRRNVLARTLPTIFTQDFPVDEYEVVIVVDGSTDGTSELLHSLKPSCALRIYEQPNRGQA